MNLLGIIEKTLRARPSVFEVVDSKRWTANPARSRFLQNFQSMNECLFLASEPEAVHNGEPVGYALDDFNG